MFRITDVVKHLLIINVLFFLITHLLTTDILAMISGGLFNKEMLPLYYFESNKFLPIQIVTHFFMHGGFAHIFFNMFALVMFGSALETAWGPRRFLFFYLYCALGAALLHTGYNYIDFSNMQSAIDAFAADPSWSKFHHFYKDYVPLDKLNYEYRDEVQRVKDALDDGNMLVKDQAISLMGEYRTFKMGIPTVGASGAIYGLLLAFGMMFPNTELMLIFLPIPIKAKYFIPILMVAELYLGLNQFSWDNIAHFAHLGGALFGFLMILYWRKFGSKL